MFGWHFFFQVALADSFAHVIPNLFFFSQNIVYFSIGYITFQSILWYSISFLLLFFIKCLFG